MHNYFVDVFLGKYMIKWSDIYTSLFDFTRRNNMKDRFNVIIVRVLISRVQKNDIATVCHVIGIARIEQQPNSPDGISNLYFYNYWNKWRNKGNVATSCQLSCEKIRKKYIWKYHANSKITNSNKLSYIPSKHYLTIDLKLNSISVVVTGSKVYLQ